MWEFIKSWKFMAIIFAVLTTVVVVLLVVGISTHTEPGFIADAPEWTHYEPADFPLRVEAYYYTSEDEDGHHSTRIVPGTAHASAIDTAMSRFNERAGFTVFSWAPGEEDGEVEITLNVPVESRWTQASFAPAPDTFTPWSHDDHPGGNSYQYRVPSGLRLNHTCGIHTMNIAGAGDLEVLVIYHELGHCLLLDHDDFQQSIMCGGARCTLAPTPDGVIPPWLDDFDRDLVRRTYRH